MFTNIKPFVCCNAVEFDDERKYLRERTFPRIRSRLKQFSMNFEPTQIDCDLDNGYVRSGQYLRLLLHNIERSSPFFLCLLGQQYGPYMNKAIDFAEFDENHNAMQHLEMNWVEKNILIASQTGYSHIINHVTIKNSLLEFQINTALYDEASYPYYRFYFRQTEYLDDKLAHLSMEDRKIALQSYMPENDYCDFKIKDIKMKIAKKGLSVKYYRSLEQLDKLVYDDFMEMVEAYLTKNATIKRSRQFVKLENLVYRKLNNYVLTDSLVDLFRSVDSFLKQKPSQSVRFKIDTPTLHDIENADDLDYEQIESIVNSFVNEKDREEYLEILKLKHLNVANMMKSNSAKPNCKQIFLILGTRSSGKSAFMAFLYQHYVLKSPPPYNNLMRTIDPTQFSVSNGNSRQRQRSQAATTPSVDPLILFYFLQSDDYLLSVLVDITSKMRHKYSQKDSTSSLNEELHDPKSIVEQFHASLNLGPIYIFIDGLNECLHTLKYSTWLPARIENPECKIVLTMSKSSDSFGELSSRKTCVVREVNMLTKDSDYTSFFARLLCSSNPHKFGPIPNSNQSQNVLYAKFMSFFHELKTANHIKNPLYVRLIAQEIFSFDRDIYKTHPVHIEMALNQAEGKGAGLPGTTLISRELKEGHAKLHGPSKYKDHHRKVSVVSAASSTDSTAKLSVNIINSYIEEVTTLRELIQKIVKRYLKKNNWSTDYSLSLNPANPGWIGDTLCLIALSRHGITKEAIMRILKMRGYHGPLRVQDFHWSIFRMKFGNFIQDGIGGRITFAHDYFREAVQSLLLNGFSVTVETKPEFHLRTLKKNISNKEIEMHLYIIADLLKNCIGKNEFDSSVQIDSKSETVHELAQIYLETFDELIYHLYMIHDLVNLCKLLTSFKVIHLFNQNRINNLNAWYSFVNYIKMTMNIAELRPILLSSLTIGLPKYAFELRDKQITIKRLPDSHLKSLSGGDTKDAEMALSLSEQAKSVKEEAHHNQQIYKKQKKTVVEQLIGINSQNINEVYEPLLDTLVDLSDDFIDVTNSKYSDSVSMILINRVSLFLDLMRNLEDKYFQESLSLPLCDLTNNIIVESFPLSDTEKLKYSFFLEIVSKCHIQANENEKAAKHLIKSIEILEDLTELFYFTEVNAKFKNRNFLLYVLNKLCIHYTILSFLLLKLNDINGAEMLLTKANAYLTEKRTKLISSFDRQVEAEANANKLEMKEKEKRDTSCLTYRTTLTSIYNENRPVDNSLLLFESNENGLIVEAKFNFYFVTGLLEVQKNEFGKANQSFESALNLCIKWYGLFHFNTAKIYHYYGCFFSLPETDYFNPSKAELFFRKALYIREREKITSQTVEASGFTQSAKPSTVNLNISDVSNEDKSSSRSASSSRMSTLENYYEVVDVRNINEQPNVNESTNESTNKQSHVFNEEQNTIAEILFDLGCLLSTYESSLARREAIECLRRSLDIKTLILGLNHADCAIIKKRLNQVVEESLINSMKSPVSQQLMRRSQSSISYLTEANTRQSFRPASSVKNYTEISPKQRLDRYLKDFKTKTETTSSTDSSNVLDQWIRQNSIIEMIPSKMEKKAATELLKTSTDVKTEPSVQKPDENEILMSLKTKSSTRSTQSATRPQAFRSVTNLDHSQFRRPVTNESIRRSIDVNNMKLSLNANPSLSSLLTPNPSSMDNRLKTVKNIYYRTAWHDNPAGSIRARYKNFIKLAPNA